MMVSAGGTRLNHPGITRIDFALSRTSPRSNSMEYVPLEGIVTVGKSSYPFDKALGKYELPANTMRISFCLSSDGIVTTTLISESTIAKSAASMRYSLPLANGVRIHNMPNNSPRFLFNVMLQQSPLLSARFILGAHSISYRCFYSTYLEQHESVTPIATECNILLQCLGCSAG